MNKAIDEIIGAHLDSNGTMVLFDGITIDCTLNGDTGHLYGHHTFKEITADDAANNITIGAIMKYLMDAAKSHTIIFSPTIHNDDEDFTEKTPAFYKEYNESGLSFFMFQGLYAGKYAITTNTTGDLHEIELFFTADPVANILTE